MAIKLIGAHINLRTLNASDAASLHQFAQEAEIARYTFVPHPYSRKHAEDFIALTGKEWKKKTGYHLGIEDKTSVQIIGMVGLQQISQQHRRAEIGYWLGKPFWGQGWTAEAIRLMLGYAFDELDFLRIQATVMVGNSNSMKLLRKVGFVREGKLRSYLFKNNESFDCHLYSMVEKDWRK